MFSYLRAFFRKKHSAKRAAEFIVARGSVARPKQPSAADAQAIPAPAPMPRVETAQLQLAAIVARFPDELRKLVLTVPPPDAMVALPLPTIQKFLPTGSVKMSLASVVRQAPPGTFATINTGDKRLVEVPLVEIFKRISPALLKKRDDQRFTELAAAGFDIFGDESNPHAIAPRFEGQTAAPATPASVPTPAAHAQRTLQNPLGIGIVPPPGVSANSRASTPPVGSPPRAFPSLPDPTDEESEPRLETIFSPTTSPAPAKVEPPAAADQPPLVLPVKDLAQGWPEPIKSEVNGLNGTTVSLPSSSVSVGLAKGKVAFAWGQLRSWMEPTPGTASAADEATELLLPLRVVAPAFIKHTRQAQQQKSVTMDVSIPELFGSSRATAASPTSKAEAPVAPEPELATDLQGIPEPEVTAPEASAPETGHEPEQIEQPVAPVVEPEFNIASETQPEEPLVLETPTVEVEENGVIASPVAAAVDSAVEPLTLGEAFGDPEKAQWSPSEIVSRVVKLPGMSGAAVALQEGLVIAHELPEPMKGEVFAAFLPQIFARLNQYANEMKLGAIEDIVLQSSNGPCHVFKRGQIFFAALGTGKEALPTPILRLCADALSDH